MTRKWNPICIIVIFLLSITLPLAFSDFPGGNYSRDEQRTLGTFPIIITEDNRLASGIKTNGEKWLDDNIGFRAPLKSLQKTIDYDFFKLSPSSKVIIGEDGWYYYTRDNNLAIGLGTYSLSEEQLEKIKIKQTTIHGSLRDRGIDYILVLVPSKASIYPEFIGGSTNARVTIIDILSDYLVEYSSIPVINLKPYLLKSKGDSNLYFKTDTHWNDEGLYVGYRSMIHELTKKGLINSRPVEVTKSQAEHLGDLSRLMGVANSTSPENYEAIEIKDPQAVRVESGIVYDDFSKLIMDNYSKCAYYYYENSKVEKKSVLIFGDSFFKIQLIELMAEHFSNVYYVDSHLIDTDLIYFINPDYVLLESTEREFKEIW